MMRYKGYFAKVEFDADARILHGEVIGIRDVVTFQTDAAHKVEKEFRASVDDYLAFCKQRNEEPDKPFSGKFLVRVPPELHRRLDIIAKVQKRSLNSVIEEFLDRELSSQMPTRAPLGKRKARKSAVRPRGRAKAVA